MHNDATSDGTERTAWILLALTCGLSVIPVFGFASWIIAWPMLIAAFALSIVTLSRGRTGSGIVLLLSSVIFAPTFVLCAPIVSSILGFGTAASAPDSAANISTGASKINWRVIGALIFICSFGSWLFSHLRPKTPPNYGPVAVPGSGFIFQPPEGWTVESEEKDAIPWCFGPTIGGFRTNIIFQYDDSPGGVESSLARAKAFSAGQIGSWKELSYDWFYNHQGKQGVRLIAEGSQSGYDLRYTIYVFQYDDGAKLQIYCTSPSSHGAIFDGAFDIAVQNMTIS